MTDSFKNARLTAIRHVHNLNRLILSFEDRLDYEFDNVADFSLSGFFPHNILFDLYEYRLDNLPARLAAEFPILTFYLHSGEEWRIFHLSPQAGLGGIIVCATL